MDVAYINPFIVSTVHTFKTMLSEDVTVGKPAVKALPFPTYDVSGIIGLSGDAQGSITMSFPKLTALKVVSKMMGMSIKVIGPELTDGIGEIANIVAGNAKQHLSNCNLSISLPNVVVGRSHVISAPSGSASIVVPFQSSLGDFAVEVTLKTK
jgi:chemotaxis protein CheX